MNRLNRSQLTRRELLATAGSVAAGSVATDRRGYPEREWPGDRLRVRGDPRLRGIDEFIRAFESEHGEITEADVDEATRAMRARATVVRGGSTRLPA